MAKEYLGEVFLYPSQIKNSRFDIGGLENLVVDDETTVSTATESADTSMDFDSFLSVLDGLLLDLGFPLEDDQKHRGAQPIPAGFPEKAPPKVHHGAPQLLLALN